MTQKWLFPQNDLLNVSLPYSQYLGLVYHDLFNYPLTLNELNFWQIGEENFPKFNVQRLGSYYYLEGREDIILKRMLAHKESTRKYEIAKRAARTLSILPTVEMVAVSGSLAMGNSRSKSDVELFLVSSVDCLLITRLFCFIALKLFSLSTKRAGDNKDKLNVDVFIDKNNLCMAQRCDVYTAHGIAQVKVLFDKGGVYRKFINENSWVKQFFPNAYKKILRNSRHCTNYQPTFSKKLFGFFFISFSRIINFSVKLCVGNKVGKEKTRFQVSKVFVSRLESISKKRSLVCANQEFSD